MTASPVESINDETFEDIEQKLAVIRFGLPFNEVIGKPREMRVCDLKDRLAPSMKGRRIIVRVRP